MDHYTAVARDLLDRFVDIGPGDFFDELDLRNEVAQWVLSAIDDTLRQVGSFDGEGELHLGREPLAPAEHFLTVLPRHLFTINWADTAPGVSWPESYHLIAVPAYDRFIVTATQDGSAAYGVAEIAIGQFPQSADPIDGAKSVIQTWWSFLRGQSGQDRWAYVWDEGEVGKKAAEEWADEVWSFDDDFDEDEE